MTVVISLLVWFLVTTALQIALDTANLVESRRRAERAPDRVLETMDEATYARSVRYTLAKGKLRLVVRSIDALLVVGLLVTPVLSVAYRGLSQRLGTGIVAQAAFLTLVSVVSAVVHLPSAYWAQFVIEERFGFNRTRCGLWVLDRIKGFALAGALGLPLLLLVLWLMHAAGDSWWIFGFAAVTCVQLFVAMIFPRFILPIFNKLTPLPEGVLRDRLFALAERTRFRVASIHVMDGSRRSTHANAFFAGMGRFRRIVLFDTLVADTTEAELEAVLAHEIGHSKLGHIKKSMVYSALAALVAFWAVAWLLRASWLYDAFSLPPDALGPALVLVFLLLDMVGFWFTPFGSWLSRKHEYEADDFARKATGTAEPLIAALRKLARNNLSNLTPHPWYVGFYYSHPTLAQREAALRG